MLLVQDYARPRFYVSPIQIDPMHPAVPISSPPGYAAQLAERIGLYHTIGMPEETWSLNEEHISDAAWIPSIRAMKTWTRNTAIRSSGSTARPTAS